MRRVPLDYTLDGLRVGDLVWFATDFGLRSRLEIFIGSMGSEGDDITDTGEGDFLFFIDPMDPGGWHAMLRDRILSLEVLSASDKAYG